MNVGDSVCSNIARNMIGRIVKIMNNAAIILVDGKEIYADLNYWHKIWIIKKRINIFIFYIWYFIFTIFPYQN